MLFLYVSVSFHFFIFFNPVFLKQRTKGQDYETMGCSDGRMMTNERGGMPGHSTLLWTARGTRHMLFLYVSISFHFFIFFNPVFLKQRTKGQEYETMGCSNGRMMTNERGGMPSHSALLWTARGTRHMLFLYVSILFHSVSFI